MPYDEALAARLRELLAERPDLPGVTEQRMFGGLAFLVGGRMAIAASGQGGALVRVPPDEADVLVARGSAEVAVMGNRAMTGWLRVPDDRLRTRRQLEAWVARGLRAVDGLPARAEVPATPPAPRSPGPSASEGEAQEGRRRHRAGTTSRSGVPPARRRR